MSTITLAATYPDEDVAWDVNLALERAGIDSSRIDITDVAPMESEPTPKTPTTRVARRSVHVAAVVAAVGGGVGAAIAAAIDSPWWIGALIGTAVGVWIGLFIGVTWSFPMNPELLAPPEPVGALKRIVVEVDPDDESKVADALTAASPVTGPTRLAA